LKKSGRCVNPKLLNFKHMHYVRLLILYLGMASTLFLLIGLYKPWSVLWWEDFQNRMKVIKVYGTLMIVFFAVYYVLKFLI
jgi:hypothetical protein